MPRDVQLFFPVRAELVRDAVNRLPVDSTRNVETTVPDGVLVIIGGSGDFLTR